MCITINDKTSRVSKATTRIMKKYADISTLLLINLYKLKVKYSNDKWTYNHQETFKMKWIQLKSISGINYISQTNLIKFNKNKKFRRKMNV